MVRPDMIEEGKEEEGGRWKYPEMNTPGISNITAANGRQLPRAPGKAEPIR